MRIGPKDPLSGVPQEPEEIKKKSSQAEFPAESVETSNAGSIQETGGSAPARSVYANFNDTAELGGEFVQQTLNDFKGSIADGDLGKIGKLLQEQTQEDPFIQTKLDRILSLAK